MIGFLLHARAARRVRALGRSAADAQRATLRRLLRRAARTRFGEAHGFRAIRTPEEFRVRVPAQDYASLLPYFERARDGARDEVWPGAPVVFAMTSGTTGGNKFLPHTKASLRSAMAGSGDALSAYVSRARDFRLLSGRIAFLGGSLALERFASGMPWGDNTGILAGREPLWVRPFRSPSSKVLAMPGWEERLAAAARELAGVSVRLLLGVPSWTLLLIDAVEREAGASIRDVWPRWSGFIHGGMAFAPYADTYRRRAGAGIVYVDTYSATEGGMLAVQDRDGDPSMALLPDRGVYFEFARADEPEGPRVGVHEVETDIPYLVHVTTEQGLWAYRIGDIVRFTSVDPPRLVLAGRQRSFLNAFGEHVSEEEMDRAIAGSARENGGEAREYAVLPEYPDHRRSKGRHLWLVEFQRPPYSLDRFAAALDATLASGNDDYRTHRAGNAQLEAPRVRLLPQGAFYAWMRRRNQLGGQHKVPRVLDATLAGTLLGEAAGEGGGGPEWRS